MSELVDAGADVDMQDRNQWTALMWAMTNRHKSIAKLLLDHGASAEQKTSSGRTAFDFVPPDSDMSWYLQSSGYALGTAGVTDDFYNAGFTQDRFEEEMAAQEQRQRLMMDSARDLEVDLGNVGIDDQPEVRPLFPPLERNELISRRSLSMSLRRNSRSSIGLGVHTTRCSSSRSPN